MRDDTIRVLLVFAHPDDETFCVGGVVAIAAQRGFSVSSLCATRGEEGLVAPEAGGVLREELPKVREQEMRNAAAVLGIHDVTFLNYHDGALREASSQEGTAAVFAHLERVAPHVTITFSPNDGITGHWDHRTIGRWTTDAFQEAKERSLLPEGARLYWTVMARERMPADMPMMEEDVAKGLPLDEISTPLDVRKGAEKKRQALFCHATQQKDVDNFLNGGTKALAHEYLCRIVPPWRRGQKKEQWIWG